MTFRAIYGPGLLLAVASLATAQPKPGPIISTGLAPHASSADYQAQGQTGTVTIAADFVGHSVPTPEATFTTDQYIVFETGLFGKPGDRLILSPDHFSLKINGKKSTLQAQPYAMLFESLKDPDWEEAQAVAKVEKSKTSVNGGGGGGGGGADEPKPAPPKMPLIVARAMQQKVQKASLPEGDRPLPVAGLLFFPYGGNVKKVSSLELLYTGPAGKAKLTIQP
jgi:hypothetical protein